MKQRTTEWIEKNNSEYHEKQFKEPYRSTIAFCDWLEAAGYIQKDSQLKILDLGSGQGANTYYMAKRYPECTFVGLDINPDIIAKGNRYLQNLDVKNCSLEVGDIYNLNSKFISEFDGIVSYQTLSWLPDFKEPIESIIKLNSQWIALTSLFYDGQVSSKIEVKEYNDDLDESLDIFYNIYSLPVVKKFLSNKGYSGFQYVPFEIDIDLPKPIQTKMGTYTEKLENGKRIQISGPLLMQWHFIGCRKKK